MEEHSTPVGMQPVALSTEVEAAFGHFTSL